MNRLSRRREREAKALEQRLVWIVGGPRTGSTWLLDLLTYPLTHAHTPTGAAIRNVDTVLRPFAIPINEPYLGAHLAPIETIHPLGIFTPAEIKEGDPSYFFSREFEPAWRPGLRSMILDRFGAQATALAAEHQLSDPLVVVKEPNGSQAAPLIASALPGSRLIYLMRDARDVLESLVDAVTPGSWLAGGLDTDALATEHGRLEFLRRHAWLWLHRTTMIERAMASHPPELSFTVRYEDLRADTEASLATVVEWLGVEAAPGFLAETTRANSFESFPPEATGRGKATRFAEPGHWRQGLGEPEKAVLGDILGPKLRDLGYAV